MLDIALDTWVMGEGGRGCVRGAGAVLDIALDTWVAGEGGRGCVCGGGCLGWSSARHSPGAGKGGREGGQRRSPRMQAGYGVGEA